jgi:hypothetical protein
VYPDCIAQCSGGLTKIFYSKTQTEKPGKHFTAKTQSGKEEEKAKPPSRLGDADFRLCVNTLTYGG